MQNQLTKNPIRLRPYTPSNSAAQQISFVVVAILAITLQGGCRNTTRVESTAAAGWATRVNEPPIPNFYKVSDDLYRGAQPSIEHLAFLRAIGITTLVNLRGDDRYRDAAGAVHLRYEHIPMSAIDPRDEHVIQFLRLFAPSTDNSVPVFVHCQHGADRTGLLCAMYRITVQGWSKQDAIDEMTLGGMHYYKILSEPVDYIRQADIESLRAEAGLIVHSSAQ